MTVALETRLRIAQVQRCDPETLARLFESANELPKLLQQRSSVLRDIGLDESNIRRLHKTPATLEITKAWLEHSDNQLLAFNDGDYPTALKTIPDPPPLLYVQGDVDCLRHPQLAIVGARKATLGGRDTAHAFAATLASHGLAITSGLALGIDTAAHEGALAASGMTIAVMGTGLDQVYPAANHDLAIKIRQTGALISELPLGTGPRKHHFPARNRLIGGLCLGVLVVEAAEQSGSLITARLSAEQGREVFAIPGSIHNPMAKGCHRLIREGARLTESVADIFNEISDRLTPPAYIEPPVRSPSAEKPHDPLYERVLDALEFGPASVDQISESTGLTIAEVSSMLLILELDTVVEALPGRRYARRPQER